MKNRSSNVILQTALMTFLTIGVSMTITQWVLREADQMFWAGKAIISVPISILSSFLIPYVGGAIWGYALSQIYDKENKSLIRSTAKTWALTVIVTNLFVVGQTFIFQLPLRDSLHPMKISYYVLIVFSIAVGISAAFNSAKLAKNLGKAEIQKAVGKYTGIGAVIGFVAAYAVMHWLGWKLGNPYEMKSSKMNTVVMVGYLSASLFAGGFMGWQLVRSNSENEAL